MNILIRVPALLLALAVGVGTPATAFADDATAPSAPASVTSPEPAAPEPPEPTEPPEPPEPAPTEDAPVPSEPAPTEDAPAPTEGAGDAERPRPGQRVAPRETDDSVLTDVYVTNQVFYPRVRDHYKESTFVQFSYDPYNVETGEYEGYLGWQVRSVADGWIVRSGTKSAYCWCEVSWNGVNNAGNVVKPGDYTITVTAYDALGEVWDTFSRTVTVATKTVTRTGTSWKWGDALSSKSVRGNCYVSRDTYFDETLLDCWGGRYAQVVYYLWVPGGSTLGDRWVRGTTGCCDRGIISKRFERIAANKVKVTVRVTNWRSYTVERVNVKYSYAARI